MHRGTHVSDTSRRRDWNLAWSVLRSTFVNATPCSSSPKKWRCLSPASWTRPSTMLTVMSHRASDPMCLLYKGGQGPTSRAWARHTALHSCRRCFSTLRATRKEHTDGTISKTRLWGAMSGSGEPSVAMTRRTIAIMAASGSHKTHVRMGKKAQAVTIIVPIAAIIEDSAPREPDLYNLCGSSPYMTAVCHSLASGSARSKMVISEVTKISQFKALNHFSLRSCSVVMAHKSTTTTTTGVMNNSTRGSSFPMYGGMLPSCMRRTKPCAWMARKLPR
mmetsp:Transcript_27114/g.75601  ORF Transcript_27114/g.75601 Transcript_27114/m.75601 type:complete len:276 (+) Transcript_27114:1244-2071(+)